MCSCRLPRTWIGIYQWPPRCQKNTISYGSCGAKKVSMLLSLMQCEKFSSVCGATKHGIPIHGKVSKINQSLQDLNFWAGDVRIVCCPFLVNRVFGFLDVLRLLLVSYFEASDHCNVARDAL